MRSAARHVEHVLGSRAFRAEIRREPLAEPCHRSAALPSACTSTCRGPSFIAAFVATVEVFRSRLINGTED